MDKAVADRMYVMNVFTEVIPNDKSYTGEARERGNFRVCLRCSREKPSVVVSGLSCDRSCMGFLNSKQRKVVLLHQIFRFFPFGENFCRRDVEGGDFKDSFE
eukprot:8495503-Prorocentrum_lima.AAC.1